MNLSSADLVICLNLGDLGTYVGLPGILALARDFDVSVRWLPVTGGLQRLSSRKPDEPDDDPLAAYKARRALARHNWAERELQRDCERLGISVAAGRRSFDPSLLNLGLLYLSDNANAAMDFVSRGFKAAFDDGADVASNALVTGLVGDPAFAAWAGGVGPEAQEQLQAELLEAGIFNSPAFLLEGEVFQGRQHLPLLRWRLGGALGTPPV